MTGAAILTRAASLPFLATPFFLLLVPFSCQCCWPVQDLDRAYLLLKSYSEISRTMSVCIKKPVTLQHTLIHHAHHGRAEWSSKSEGKQKFQWYTNGSELRNVTNMTDIFVYKYLEFWVKILSERTIWSNEAYFEKICTIYVRFLFIN